MLEVNDPYDYNLQNIRSEIKNKWDDQQEDELRKRQQNGVVGLGGGSWTSRINRFNANKRDEYMKALEAANNQRRQDTQQSLAQRQQAFSEASNYSNLARLEKERTENMEARKRQEEEQKRQLGMQHELSQQQAQEQKSARLSAEGLAKEKFAYQKQRDTVADKDAAILRNVQLRQQSINRRFEARRLSMQEYQQQTRANLEMIEAQTRNLQLKQEASQLAKSGADPDTMMQQLQGMMGQMQGTGRDMNNAGLAQQNAGMSLYNSLNATQQQEYQRELARYMDYNHMAQRAKEIGEQRAYQEEMQRAADKAAKSGAFASIITNVIGTGAQLLLNKPGAK
ncbi:hypothetical protein [Candidatus Endomicrobiellum devescovinae]|jgi:hypothetical protein|uniref:hypothetical protein n=1 Tax=Candidatus Endomicrobiellum devescovinae TaxID=3242322 RepID=UPI002819567E|nr:hypothetical protein [Endomicrobium sp.]